MSYCTIEEAWGNNFKDSRKKKKTKRLYTTNIPDAVYNRSHIEGSLDPHCKKKNSKNFTIKNKHRHTFSRGGKDIYRPKRSSRHDNINYSHDNARKEYKNYKKETKKATKNEISNEDLIDNNEYNRSMNSNNESSAFEDELSDFGNQGYYNVYQENDFDLEPIQSGTDYSSDYQIDDSQGIQQQMYKLQEEQRKDLERQQEKIQEQMLNQGFVNNMRTNDYNSTDNDSSNENYTLSNTFYDGIEGFENNSIDMDNMSLEHFSEDERVNNISDVDVPSPEYSPNNKSKKNNVNNNNKNNKSNNKNNNKSEESLSESDSDSENNKKLTIKNTKNNAKRSNNFLDNLLNKVGLNNNDSETNNEDSNDSDSDSDEEDLNRLSSGEDEKLKYVNENSKDIDYRLNTLNRNVNLIIKKMNKSQFFDDDSQDNIHDLILFILFGIFIIFVLDTIYRFGKKTGNNNY